MGGLKGRSVLQGRWANRAFALQRHSLVSWLCPLLSLGRVRLPGFRGYRCVALTVPIQVFGKARKARMMGPDCDH